MAKLGLARTNRNEELQSFVADPDKSQVTASMTGVKIFKKDLNSDVNITDWFAISVSPSSDTTYYFNNDSSKTKTIYSGTEAIVFVYRQNITQVVFNFGAGTAEIQGM